MLKKCFIFLMLFFLNIFLNGQDSLHWESIVNDDFIWKYQTGSVSIPPEWKEPDFNDEEWENGNGGFGYGYDNVNTLIPSSLSLYLRYSFLLDTSVDIMDIRFYIDYDDGFIAYLNGTEIARGNMDNAGSVPAFDVMADDCDHEAGFLQGGTPDLYILKNDISSLLVEGYNKLAIQVHNCSPTSSDFYSSAWLIARVKGDSMIFNDTPDWFRTPPDGNSNLPLIIIDTDGESIPDEPKITSRMKIIYHGEGELNYMDDTANVYNGWIGIEVRGQSSQALFPKDSYTVETRDSLGEDLKVPLLGMPKESDWVLYAPYSDKSLLRNAVSYHFARKMGSWAPGFRFCEVYLNGDYQGIYLLTEKIKRDNDRLDIEKTFETHNAGDSLTGGYILRVDKIDELTEDIDYFYTSPEYIYPESRSYAFSYYYPEAHKITPQQKEYIQNFIFKAESMLNSPNFKDEQNGYYQYFDLNSFADHQIIKEFGNDVDSYRYSAYFYKNADSKDPRLYAGPVWDHNLCFGNVNFSETARSTDVFRYTNIGTNSGKCMHWWYRMMEDDYYVSRLHRRYTDYRDNFFSNEAVMDYIDEQIAYLSDAISRNFNRWPIIGKEIWPNFFVGDTYEEEIFFLKSWILLRFDFLDSHWYEVVSSHDPEFSDHYEFSVYPNPFSSYVQIAADKHTQLILSVKIYNITGQLIHEASAHTHEELHLDFLEKGIYFLSVFSRKEKLGIVKVVKQ